MEVCELKPHSPDYERLSEITQRRHTHHTDHKLEKRHRIHKMAKMLARKLTSYIPLPFGYNVTNTVQLTNDLIDIPYDHNIKFVSFDINSTYSEHLRHRLDDNPQEAM